jgi:ribosome-binding ATPase YchF (GTP1/OBG family)
MSDKSKQQRAGGAFTFLLALAAFIMSGFSLFQQNASQETIEKLKEAYEKGKVQVVEGGKKAIEKSKEAIEKLSDKMSDGVTWESIVESLRDVREKVAAEGGSFEAAAEKLREIANRIDAYIAEASQSGSPIAAETEEKLRELQASLRKTRFAAAKSAGANPADRASAMDALIADAEALSANLSAKPATAPATTTP